MKLSIHTWLSLLAAFIISPTFAQDWCATHTKAEEAIQHDPQLKQQLEDLWNMSSPAVTQTNVNSRGSRDATYIVPVVFHIIHDNGIGDIPYEQLESAVEVLNEDFRRTNSDSASTRSVFKPFAVDSDIEFRIARVDPDGNCTNGVVRINNPTATNDADNGVKSLSYWPSNQYMNIWVVNTIASSSNTNGIILGYAQFPGFGNWNTYGIVVRNDRIGKFGVGTSVSDGRTLTHEVGHCFNLLHTFQSGCGSDCSFSGDRVCDTPPSSNSTFGCSFNQNTCSNDANGSSSVFGADVNDQIENYMSYDDCQNMFSAGQRNRMHAVLNGIPQLANLVSTSNLQATGVINPVDVLCKADFSVSTTTTCIGQSVQFEDLSYFNPTEYKWEFENGFPATSTDQNPIVTYNESGSYNVTLTIKNATDSVSTTRTELINVLPYPGAIAPFTESFEFNSLADNNWSADNLTSSDYGWELSNQAYNGSNSLLMKQFAQEGRSASIISPSYSLSGLEEATVSFYAAYARRNTTNFDILRVYISPDCGETWQLRFVSGGAALETVPTTSSPLTNITPSDWQLFEFTLQPIFFTENVRLRFEMISDGGNFLYIDDINITGTQSEIPVLLEPLDLYNQASTTETLDWKATGVVDEYEVWVDTASTFDSPVLQTQGINYVSSLHSGADSEWTPTNLTVGQTYYWRVRTITGGVTSDWSQTWSFTVAEDDGGPPPATGIADANGQLNWNIYPNPVRDQLKIVANVDGAGSISLTNLQGQLIYQTSVQLSAGNSEVVEVSQLPAGLYIIAIESQELGNTQQKVLIQH